MFPNTLSLFFKEENVVWSWPCVYVYICLGLQFKLLKQLTYFYETWSELFVIRGNSNGSFTISYNREANSNMTGMHIYDVASTLETLNLGPWNETT
jgi:hypothetical protein